MPAVENAQSRCVDLCTVTLQLTLGWFPRSVLAVDNLAQERHHEIAATFDQ
jgi:hypothetical protein